MVLEFEFNYVGNNDLLENFLQEISASGGCEFYIKKSADFVYLYAQGTEKELADFSDHLAQELPYSIFLRSTAAKVVEKFNRNESSKIAPCEVILPMTPKSMKEAEKTGDFRIKSEIGKEYVLGEVPTIEEAVEKLISELAPEAIGGDCCNFGITTESYTINLLKPANSGHFVIMPTDLKFLPRIAVASEEEAAAISAIERPVVEMKLNAIFRAKYLDSFPLMAHIALPGDLYLYLLCLELAKRDVEAIAVSNYHEHITKHKNARAIVMPLKTQNVLVSAGDFLPQKIDKFLTIKEPHFRIFAAAIEDQNKKQDRSLGFYFSDSNDDYVMFNSPETGAKELLKVWLPDNIDDLLAAIESDETGAKLLENYKAKFPENFANFLAIKEDAAKLNIRVLNNGAFRQNIAALWAIAAVFTGLSNSIFDSAHTADSFHKILHNAAFSAAPKGQRIDYKLKSGENAIDGVRFLRSVISFKLAGADNEILSLGIVESLAHFISDLVSIVCNKETTDFTLIETRNFGEFIKSLDFRSRADAVFFTGRLFACAKLSEIALEKVGASRKCYFPSALALE
ncbi:MAG: hypothetical protein LBU73_03275 [Helicobacteraceae bacterium]|jgi:hypothetical protein|nr:hypothetical protein [Helicobacteraceae bacterium]